MEAIASSISVASSHSERAVGLLAGVDAPLCRASIGRGNAPRVLSAMHPMPLSNFVTFWVVSIVFVLTPGADWAFAISGGMHRAVAPAVSGLLLGHLAAVLVVAAGVGGVIARVPMALFALMVLGSGYLFVLGVAMLRTPATTGGAKPCVSGARSKWVYEGACVSGLNPKVFLLFLALLPQFTAPSAALPISAQLLALGMVHVVSCGFVYVVVGLGAQAILVSRPGASLAMTRLSGAAMVVISICLLASQVTHLLVH